MANDVEQCELRLEAKYRGGWLRTPQGYRRQQDLELKDVVKAQHGGKVTYYATPLSTPELKEDREIVLEVVKQTGPTGELAALELKADREIELEAVKQEELAGKEAALDLKVDCDIVLEAVKQKERGRAGELAAPELKAVINN